MAIATQSHIHSILGGGGENSCVTAIIMGFKLTQRRPSLSTLQLVVHREHQVTGRIHNQCQKKHHHRN